MSRRSRQGERLTGFFSLLLGGLFVVVSSFIVAIITIDPLSPTPGANPTPVNVCQVPIFTPGPSPTRPTQTPYPYAKQPDPETYTAYPGGCAWMGVAGQVFDSRGGPRTDVQIHVWNDNLDITVESDSDDAYGPSGWSVTLGDTPKEAVYFIQLLDARGGPLSDSYALFMRPSCQENLVILNFAP